MKFGAVLPTNEIGHDTGAVKAWAQAVDEMGYDRIVVYDHVLGAVHADREPPLTGPYTEDDPFREPMVFLGYLAGVTENVELMPGVLILPQRQTALVAKQAVEIDLLSGGRFVLGVGTGWNWVEYESLGIEYGGRGKRLDEQVELLRRLWRERVVDFDGRFHRVDRAGLYPMPEREIPIWFGGFSEPSMRRAARIGDGFYFAISGSRMIALLDQLRGYLAAEGRDAETFQAAAQIHTGRGADQCRKDTEGWKAVDGSHVFVSTMTSAVMRAEERPCATVDDHIALLGETLEMMRAVDA
jgi:probable F420-dependent oxidoreductase